MRRGRIGERECPVDPRVALALLVQRDQRLELGCQQILRPNMRPMLQPLMVMFAAISFIGLYVRIFMICSAAWSKLRVFPNAAERPNATRRPRRSEQDAAPFLAAPCLPRVVISVH
jgi:hypothetical protein